MTLRGARWALVGLAGAWLGWVSLCLVPRPAEACGGCFAPYGAPTVVTAHRMVLALSATQTTLWDQIAYAGAPEDFVWVLPVSADATIELADDRFFDALERATNVSLRPGFAPLRTTCALRLPTNADVVGDSYWTCEATDGSMRCTSAAPEPPGVMVHEQGTVGPYEMATVSSDDPMALLVWLRDHGYAVPDEMLPTIRFYGEMGMAFAALRLRPGEGVQRMDPVRVTMPGASYVLPLRMVAAGVADSVAIRLFVIGEGRYGAHGFPNAVIDARDVVYDWQTRTFSYDGLFEQALDRGAWVTLYAGALPLRIGGAYAGADGARDVDDDLLVAREGIAEPVLTRLEASLGRGALDRDLELGIATDASDVSRDVVVTREAHRPPEPDCGGPQGCSVTDGRPGPGHTGPTPIAIVGLAALAILAARRTRRVSQQRGSP